MYQSNMIPSPPRRSTFRASRAAILLLLGWCTMGCDRYDSGATESASRYGARPGIAAPEKAGVPDLAEPGGSVANVSSAAPALGGLDVTGSDTSECATARDCAYGAFPAISDPSECQCAVCPADAEAVLRVVAEERRAQFRRVCRDWATYHPCPPTRCDAPSLLACNDGKCELVAR